MPTYAQWWDKHLLVRWTIPGPVPPVKKPWGDQEKVGRGGDEDGMDNGGVGGGDNDVRGGRH